MDDLKTLDDGDSWVDATLDKQEGCNSLKYPEYVEEMKGILQLVQ